MMIVSGFELLPAVLAVVGGVEIAVAVAARLPQTVPTCLTMTRASSCVYPINVCGKARMQAASTENDSLQFSYFYNSTINCRQEQTIT